MQWNVGLECKVSCFVGKCQEDKDLQIESQEKGG